MAQPGGELGNYRLPGSISQIRCRVGYHPVPRLQAFQHLGDKAIVAADLHRAQISLFLGNREAPPALQDHLLLWGDLDLIGGELWKKFDKWRRTMNFNDTAEGFSPPRPKGSKTIYGYPALKNVGIKRIKLSRPEMRQPDGCGFSATARKGVH